MALPSGVVTCIVNFGAAKTFTGEDVQTGIKVTPSQDVVWAATGQPLVAFKESLSATTNGSIILPVVDQPGFRDADGAPVTMWAYNVEISYATALAGRAATKVIQPVSGQTSIDLDLLPSGPAAALVLGVIPTVTSWNGQTGAVFYTPPDGDGEDYTWVIAGTAAGRLTLDPAELRAGTIYVAEDGAATPKPYFVTAAHTWGLFAAPSHHEEQHHFDNVIDPLSYADVGAAPATLEDTVATLATQLASVGDGATPAADLRGLVHHGDIALGVSDTFRSAPVDTVGSVNTRVYVVADEAFTVTLDTSSDGVTFVTGVTTYTPTVGFSGHILLESVPVISRYVRLSVICGGAAMSSFSADTLNSGILG